MATRLWTPEDLGIEPVYWIRAEDQEPDFYNVITKLVDVNGNLVFEATDSILKRGFAKKKDKGCWLYVADMMDVLPVSFSSKMLTEFYSKDVKKSVAIVKKNEGSIICFTRPSSFGFPSVSYFNIFSSSSSYSYSYPFLRLERNNYYVRAATYPTARSSPSIKINIDFNNETPFIGCVSCSYKDNFLSLRENGIEHKSELNSNVEKYPWNADVDYYTDHIGVTYGVFDYSEIIVYDTVLDQSAYEKIEGYLAWKNNYVELLPLGHPYKEKPPVVDIPEPEPEGVSFLRIRSDVILDMAVQNRFGDVNIDVGSIPLRMLPLPKDSFTGETVTGHYSVYGNPKYILVPKGQVQMPLSLLFTPNNLKVYSITPCSTTLRFN